MSGWTVVRTDDTPLARARLVLADLLARPQTPASMLVTAARRVVRLEEATS